MKIAIILGTRPEIIKMAPVIFECEQRQLNYRIIHTGQHYSYNMDRLFFEELGLPQAHHYLGIKSSSPYLQGEHTGRMLIAIEEAFQREKPNIVLVQGDTNTVLAGSLCASKLHIPLGHVEAGLRSYDRSMPEEINRIIADHLSSQLYVPTSNAKNIVIREGIHHEKVFVTGNTIVDVIGLYQKKAHATDILQKSGLEEGGYFMATAHRPENVDSKERLQHIFDGLELVHHEFATPIIFPLHPRTKMSIEALQPQVPSCITFIEPVGLFEFLDMETNARAVLTDSGGVQEETCVLGVPCITLRESTERPETLDVGSNVLAGTDPERILDCVINMTKRKRTWRNPFGDGMAGKKIVEHIISAYR